MGFDEIIRLLEKSAKPGNKEGMARFAIVSDKVYGVGMPLVRKIASQAKKEEKNEGKRNELAKRLWRHGAHETRLLASVIAAPSVGWKAVEAWLAECQNWAEVDQLCMNLLGEMDGAAEKALAYSKSKEMWRKRAGFALMAVLAWHLKEGLAPGEAGKFFAAIARESKDDRNFVRKAVNWALRQIGKGSRKNYGKALALARKLAKSGDKTARWIGADAKRELEQKGRPGERA